MDSLYPIIVLPGANSKGPGRHFFAEGPDDLCQYRTLGYPGWQQMLTDDFSASNLVEDLVAEISDIVPRGPIRIIGISLGGHLGYAAALKLQSQGREIGTLCAVDCFMVDFAAPRSGWQQRALRLGLGQLRKRQIGDFANFIRARVWRTMLRLGEGDPRKLLSRSGLARRLASQFAREPMFEEELSMRIRLAETAPWVATLDVNPVALIAPAILFRTGESVVCDPAWRRRCPKISIIEMSGTHQTWFDPQNYPTFRKQFLAATREWRAATADERP